MSISKPVQADDQPSLATRVTYTHNLCVHRYIQFCVYRLHTSHDPSVQTQEGVRDFHRGNFRRENFRRREFSPPAIFAHRNFSRWEFSAPGIFIAGNFRRLEISPQIIFASNWKKNIIFKLLFLGPMPGTPYRFPPSSKMDAPPKKEN